MDTDKYNNKNNNQLMSDEVIYRLPVNNFEDYIDAKTSDPLDMEYKEVLKKIDDAIYIKQQGFNLFIGDDFNNGKIEKIIKYIEGIFTNYSAPKDICLAIYDDPKNPVNLYLENGMGSLLKEIVDELKESYINDLFDFYNGNISSHKEKLYADYEENKELLIKEIIASSEEKEFQIKYSNLGFIIMPMKDGVALSEKEFEGLDIDEKKRILLSANKLKEVAEKKLEHLKAIEDEYLRASKEVYKSYLKERMDSFMKEIIEGAICEKLINYIEDINDIILNDVVDIYTGNYEEDKEKFCNIIEKYKINVLVDNREYNHPRAIYEEYPTVNNLIGAIEYDNNNGAYTTDLTMVKAGSLLKANEGCLIIRLDDLISCNNSYYYLKKVLNRRTISYKYNKGYLEFLSVGDLEIKDIPVQLKVILLGDFESFSILYDADEDFKNNFKLKVFNSAEKELTDGVIEYFLNNIKKVVDDNNLLPVDQDSMLEIFKYFSRKAGSKNKLFVNIDELNKILIIASRKALLQNKSKISRREIDDILYEDDIIVEEIYSSFKNKKCLFYCKESIVGSVNGLSVMDFGFIALGKPLRITCVCIKGGGEIIDAHRAGNLSGKVHEKSTSILKGYLNRKLLKSYDKLPVDFYLSFEQVYGRLDGDSASVSETIAMLSALSKMPVKQNIAITGSMNQFGEIQAVGGINEKIEGFYKVCSIVDTIEGKGVIIPASNTDELSLRYEVEESIEQGSFKIYAIRHIEEAIDILMTTEEIKLVDILNTIQIELKKYSKSKT